MAGHFNRRRLLVLVGASGLFGGAAAAQQTPECNFSEEIGGGRLSTYIRGSSHETEFWWERDLTWQEAVGAPIRTLRIIYHADPDSGRALQFSFKDARALTLSFADRTYQDDTPVQVYPRDMDGDIYAFSFSNNIELLNGWINAGSAEISIEHAEGGETKTVTVTVDAPPFVLIENAAVERGAELSDAANAGTCGPRAPAGELDCFLTTAACGVVGLPDQCWELQALRRFRDGPLAAMPGGGEDVARYYDLAPKIVRRIDARPDAASVWRDVYRCDILPSAILAKSGLNGLARARYNRLMAKVTCLAGLAEAC